MSGKRYRTQIVRANRIDGGGPDALEDCLNSIPPTERLHSILSWNQGGGYTSSWVVVTEPLPHS